MNLSFSKPRNLKNRHHSFRPAVEVLEDRCQMSAGAFSHLAILPNLGSAVEQSFSTVPPSNEGNPYGIAFVPQGFTGHGVLQPGDLLVSNFNGPSGVQGTGTTIERITPSGQVSTFFTSSLIGLDTALGVLKSGYVVVGNLPNNNGMIGAGALQILDANGNVVSTLTDSKLLDGPWDLTVNDHGGFAQIFVSNVLSGTVTRIDLSNLDHGTPKVVSETQIASGYMTRTDQNALVVGPTGLAFDAKTNTLFVASTGDNEIFEIHNASTTQKDKGTGTVAVQDAVHLHGPVGLVLAPNGDLIAANGDAQNPGGTINDLVEYNQHGDFIGDFQVDPGPASGAAFGVAVTVQHGKLEFAAVNDNGNTAEVFTFNTPPPHHHHWDFWDWDNDGHD